MASSNTSSALIVSSELSDQGGAHIAHLYMNSTQPPLQQSPSFSDGPVAILWDMENCPVPNDVRPEDVAGNIRMALRVHPIIRGAVNLFSAYGDFNAFPRRLREGCQRTGVKLVDVPNGRKDAADKAILVDMFLFALDNPPPSSIMLISGDVDFAPALHILGQRGYTVILVIPSGVGVSSALSNAGRFVWDWPSVVRGEGFVPPYKTMGPPRGSQEIAGYVMSSHSSDRPDASIEEEAIVYRGASQTIYNSRDSTVISQSLSEYNTTSLAIPCYPSTDRSQSLPPGMNDVTSGCSYQNDVMFVQPGDLDGLKTQLAKLLVMFGGYLPLIRVPAEYLKIYGRPLYISEYGACKLVNLFKKMSDTISIGGKGQKKFIFLKNPKACPSAPPLALAKKDVVTGVGSSDELSDGDKVGLEEQMSSLQISGMGIGDQNLEQFKYELQEILVSYSCRVLLGSFEAIYQQRYKRSLDYQLFGVNMLGELLDKVRDVVVVLEEPGSQEKVIVAAG